MLIAELSADPATVPLRAFGYVSVPTVPFSDRDLSDLLLAARAVNARLDATGKLVVLEEGGRVVRFAQWIEASGLSLDVCRRRIVEDPRHAIVSVSFEGPILERRFHGWDMACQPVGETAFATASGTLLRAA